MKFFTIYIVFLIIVASPSSRAQMHEVSALKVTVLSTMLAGDPPFKGIGEWGFAALVEVDGRRLLFDTGARPETVFRNAQELGVDLSDISEVVISHNHWDHVGGLVSLRLEFSKKNPAALSRTHVAQGIFLSRPSPRDQSETNGLLAIKPDYEASGGVFIVHTERAELLPGVWFTGPIPRVYPERNFFLSDKMMTAQGLVEDNIPEDAGLVINTSQGLVVISGCAHAGIVNTAEYARMMVRPAPVHTAIGGFHLFIANDSTLSWTASKFREFGLTYLLSAHCTGIEASHRLRELAGLTRKTAVVSAVGSSFTLGRGIDPLLLAR